MSRKPAMAHNHNGHAHTGWTDIEDDVLTTHEHLSFSQLARMLPGRNRNMVAGRMKRLADKEAI